MDRSISADNISNRSDDTDGESCCRRCCRGFCNNLLPILMIIGVGVGIGVGTLLRHTSPFNDPKYHRIEIMYLNFPSELVIRFLTLLSAPVIACSLVSGLGGMEVKAFGKLGCKAILYFLGTTILAVLEGFAWAYGMGSVFDMSTESTVNKTMTPASQVINATALMDILRNAFPDNLMKATVAMTETHVSSREILKDGLANSTQYLDFIEVVDKTGINILGITMVSLWFGVMIGHYRSQVKSLYTVIDSLFLIIVKIMNGLLWLFPMCIAIIVAIAIVRLEDPIAYIEEKGYFLLTVVCALFLHFILFLPLLYVALTRRNPFKLMKGAFKALITAFATNDSNFTLPMTLECMENGNLVHPRITRFLCPLGASINTDGFALYQTIAVMYLANFRGIVLGPLQVFIVGLVAVATSLGVTTMTGGTIALYGILLQAAGLPLEDALILLPFDWILGRLQTMVNVWSDCIGCGILASNSRSELQGVPYDANHTTHANGNIEETKPLMPMPLPPSSPQRKSYTVKMENESGDLMVVSRL